MFETIYVFNVPSYPSLPAITISHPVNVRLATWVILPGAGGQDAPGVDICADLEPQEDHLDLRGHGADRQLSRAVALAGLPHEVVAAVEVELGPVVPGVVPAHHVH